MDSHDSDSSAINPDYFAFGMQIIAAIGVALIVNNS
jgi:hypothetical protein